MTKLDRGGDEGLHDALMFIKCHQDKRCRWKLIAEGGVGPNTPKFTNYCGIIARDWHLLPLSNQSWRDIDENSKEQAWMRVQLKFNVPATLKSFFMKSLSKKWRDYKSSLKRKYYDACMTDEEKYNACPHSVDKFQWRALVNFWDSGEGQKRSQLNKNNRSHQKLLHTSGTKSFARLYHEKKLMSSTQTSPTRTELFIDTHVHKNGNPINSVAVEKIQRMKEMMGQQSEGSQESTGRHDVYSHVMGPERHGRVRGYGLGPTPTKLWGHSSSSSRPSSDAPEMAALREKVKSLEENIQQQVQEHVQQHMQQMEVEMQRLKNMVEILSKQSGPSPLPNDVAGPS